MKRPTAAGAAAALAALVLCSGCEPAGEARIGPEGDATPAFDSLETVEGRKKAFFRFLRPMIEAENERVLGQRRRLQKLYREHRREIVLRWEDMRWLTALLEEYEVEGLNVGEISHWDNLFRRVDIVPVDLALIQAAKESGWGTSRFAREGNNFFGQRCFSEGCGIVPERRDPDAVYEVARFGSVRDSVRSYIHNLNTNPAYRRFRRLRFQQRQNGLSPDGYDLAEGIPQYSERRFSYLDEIRAMIRANRRYLKS